MPLRLVWIRSVCSLISTGGATPSIIAFGFSSRDSMRNFSSLARPSALKDSGLSSACMSAERLRSLSVWTSCLPCGRRRRRGLSRCAHRAARRSSVRPAAAGRARLRRRGGGGEGPVVRAVLEVDQRRWSARRGRIPRLRHCPKNSGHRATAARSSFIEAKAASPNPSGLAMVEAPARASMRGKTATSILPVTVTFRPSDLGGDLLDLGPVDLLRDQVRDDQDGDSGQQDEEPADDASADDPVLSASRILRSTSRL